MGNVVLKHVYKEYEKGVQAVSDFSLETGENEFIVLVGPSGCGKSTTLRMIAGLEDITAGEIYIDGRLVNNVEPKNRDIAMVFQNYALYPHMTVFQNIALSLQIRKFPKDEIKQRVEDVAKKLDIYPLLKKKPRALSGGQRQRVALGRAIVRNPKVFLLDEPLSNLDAQLRAQMRTEIIKLHNQLGTTFIYVTHDQTEAMTMATKIVVMKDGRIQQIDSPHELYEQPCNMFVAGFIGTPKMNFLNVRVVRSGEEYMLETAGTTLPLPHSELYGALEQYIGKTIVLGIRPEHIYPAQTANAANGYAIEPEIDVAELMGAETYLHFTMGGEDITARVASSCSLQAGKRVSLVIDTGRLYLFDKDTENRIMPADGQ
ncbi:MAG: ABC transporter ATP-binding protein [Burkholderiales bacterium]